VPQRESPIENVLVVPTEPRGPARRFVDPGQDSAPFRRRPDHTPAGQMADHAITEDIPPAGARAQETARVQPRAGLPGAGDIIGHYEIIRELGRGGMGVVYLARDTRLARRVAVKYLLAGSGKASSRLLAEARATARCHHENIVVIHDVDEHRGHPFMVLEYLQGRTLRQLLDEERMPARRVVELMIPVARALDRAHQHGIVHRDLKPANVFVTDEGVVKVLDFGLAKILADHGGESASGHPIPLAPAHRAPLTQTGALVGSLPYMSPEQVRGIPFDIDHQSDIWAAGIMLYELLLGEHPMAPLDEEKLRDLAYGWATLPNPHVRLPENGELADIIDRCLLADKSERMPSAGALLAELEALASGREPGEPRGDASPFAGLAAFQEHDAARFHGRSYEIAGLVTRLRSQPLVAVAGPSGAGKSSLLRAGVIPALKQSQAGWQALIVRPGRQPLAVLADVLSRLSDTAAQLGRDELAARLRDEPGLLGAELRRWARHNAGRVVIVVDQFEELYTLGADSEERAAFVACLAGVADDAASPLRVALSIRSDFIDRLAENRPFMTEVTAGLVFLAPPGRESLREALTAPVHAAGYEFESPELVDLVLDALDATPGALPLLQFTASRLWELRDPARRLLTVDSYHAIGGMSGALASHADAVLAAMSRTEQALVRTVFERLVTPERTRAVVELAELRELGGDAGQSTQAPNLIEQVTGRLADARLVVIETGQDGRGSTVEIIHESLIDGWPRLGQWLEEDQEAARFRARVQAAAREWDQHGRSEDLLWRGQAAADAGQWLERWRDRAEPGPRSGPDGAVHPPMAELGAREQQYLQAVVDLASRARLRRRRIATAGFTFLGAIALLVAFLAVRASREATNAEAQAREAARQATLAEDQAARAREQARRATAESIRARNAGRMAAARELVSDPTMVLALLREIESSGEPSGELPGRWSELVRWALHGGVARAVLAHPEAVLSAAFSPDGTRIVTACKDRLVRVWNADGTGEPLVLRGHEDWVISAAFSPDGTRIVTASFDRTARVWSADGSGEPLILRGHRDLVYSAVFSPDGRRIVTTSADRTARVWNADGSGEPLVLQGHGDLVYSAAFSPDGRRVVTASYDHTARVWNADGSSEPLILRGHENRVYSAAFSPDGRHIVTASGDHTARVWNADGTGEPLVLRGHQELIGAVAFSPDGRRIVTASSDHTARVWNADGKGEPLVLAGHHDRLYSAAFSPDGRFVVTASGDQSARVWNADGAERPLVLRGHEDWISTASFSPAGNHAGSRIVTSSADRTARVWSADGREEPVVLRGHQDRVYSASFSPDATRVVTASKDGTARVWNADGKGEPVVLRGHQDWVYSAGFSPDGSRVVTASKDGTARVWNADGRGEPLVLRGHEDLVSTASFSPDGRRIVTASKDRTARVWNADGSGEPVVLRGHQGWVSAASFSPDGRRIVTTSHDRTARVWNADGSGEPVVLRGHQAAVLTSVHGGAFDPDGRRVVTISDDKTIRVWNADGSGEPVVVRVPEVDAFSVAFSPDGTHIVSTSHAGHTVWIWPDLEPLDGPDDPKLWLATSHCLSIEQRIELLGVSEAFARDSLADCRRRVHAAREASSGRR
jgi:WD40 repeat protein/predicted Ser/Thr protein kinase